MDPFVAGSLIGAGADLVGGLVSGSKNYKLGKKQLNWQKQVQQTTWNREDNAVQRRAADLESAGMNRLLAAGSAASTSSPVHVDVPHAPDLSGIGDPILRAIETKISLAKQRADISQTEAQTKLLQGQLDQVNKNNELLQQTLDWYRDHPNSAPNIPGMASNNMREAALEWSTKIFTDPKSSLAGRIGSRIGEWLGNNYYNNMHPNRPRYGHYNKQTHQIEYK